MLKLAFEISKTDRLGGSYHDNVSYPQLFGRFSCLAKTFRKIKRSMDLAL